MKYCLGFLTASFLFFGCKKSNETNNFDSCNNTVSNIHGGVNIRMKENLFPDSRNNTLNFDCGTNELLSCGGITIDACNKKIQNDIYVSFDGLNFPGACPDVVSGAWVSIDMGILPANSYNLNFRINKHVYYGQLIVTDTNYISNIKNVIDSDIVITSDTIHKIPANTIWGEISYWNEKDSVLAKAAFNQLKGLGVVDSFYAPSNYGYFKIDQQNKVSFRNIDGLDYPKYFIFKYDGNLLTLKNFVNSYSSYNEADVFQIKIYTSTGEVYIN